MFTQLKELSEKAKINMFIKSKDNGHMELVVFFEIQQSKDENFNIAPLVLEGTPEELDRDFIQTIELFTKKNLSSLERISFVTKSIEKAEKDAIDKGKGSSTGKTTKKVEKPKETSLFDAPKEETKVTKEETVKAVAEVVKKEEPKQVTIEESIKEVETVSQSSSESTRTITPVVEKKPDLIPNYSEKVLQRMQDLRDLGYVEKPEEQQFVRGGLGLGTAYIVSSEDTEFERALMQIKDGIAKSKAMDSGAKPAQSFSEFKADEVEFPEPTILGANSPEEVEEVKKALQDAGLAPKPQPMAPAIPKEKTLDEKFDEMVEAFKVADYDTKDLIRKDATEESITNYLNWLKNNPLPSKQ